MSSPVPGGMGPYTPKQTQGENITHNGHLNGE